MREVNATLRLRHGRIEASYPRSSGATLVSLATRNGSYLVIALHTHLLSVQPYLLLLASLVTGRNEIRLGCGPTKYEEGETYDYEGRLDRAVPCHSFFEWNGCDTRNEKWTAHSPS